MSNIEKIQNSRVKDLKGQRFGRLTVVEYAGIKNKLAHWNCICDCGEAKCVRGSGLRYGQSLSCGCLRRERAGEACIKRLFKHGKTAGGNRPIYRVWANMMTRCYNQKSTSYRWYGAIGITVCEEWREFAAFLADMGEPERGLSLDRIDGTKEYSKENCRWVTQKEQCNNLKSNKILEIDGRSMSIAMWGEQPNAMPAKLIYARITNGWDAKRAVYEKKHYRG